MSKQRRSMLSLVLAALVLVALPGMAAASDLLSLVPEKAVAVGMVQLSDLRNSPVTGRLFNDTDRITSDGDAARFMEEAGIEPAKDVDTVVVAVSPDPEDARTGPGSGGFPGPVQSDPSGLRRRNPGWACEICEWADLLSPAGA